MRQLLIWGKSLLVSTALLLWVWGYNASAQEAGSAKTYSPVITGAPILSITPDARSAGMGEVGLTTTADAHSIYHNISKLAYIDKEWGVSFVYTPWLSEVAKDINLSTLTGYYSWGNTGEINHAVSASVRYFHIGEALAFQRETLIPLKIVPYELTMDLGYSIALNKHWALGASLRYLKSDYNYSVDDIKGVVNNFLVDISATYQTDDISFPNEMKGALRAAVALNNVGGKMSYNGGRSSLFAPAKMRVGLGLDLDVAPQHQVGLHLEANKLLAPTFNPSDRNAPDGYNKMNMWHAMGSSFGDAAGGASEEFKEVMWLVGAEYTYDSRFFVRSGYHYQHPTKGTNSGFTLGLGFIYEWAKVDLSYFLATQANSPLNNTFRLGVGVNFSSMVPFRVGQGYDVHRFESGRELWLGGVKIEYPLGLKGHSDADVLLHAISDALLGALALRDIGYHFPDNDPKYKGADSKQLLKEVTRLVLQKGYKVGNIDATIVAEQPKINPYVPAMQEVIAELLSVEVDQVSIKATTNEQMGFTGRQEGILALATALVYRD